MYFQFCQSPVLINHLQNIYGTRAVCSWAVDKERAQPIPLLLGHGKSVLLCKQEVIETIFLGNCFDLSSFSKPFIPTENMDVVLLTRRPVRWWITFAEFSRWSKAWTVLKHSWACFEFYWGKNTAEISNFRTCCKEHDMGQQDKPHLRMSFPSNSVGLICFLATLLSKSSGAPRAMNTRIITSFLSSQCPGTSSFGPDLQASSWV